MHEALRLQTRSEFLLEQRKLRRRRRCFEQLFAQRPCTCPPNVGKRDVAIGQLLRTHAEQCRTAAGQEMNADDMNVATRIEHEISRLRAVHDGAVERRADAIGRVRKHLQVVGREIERKIDTAGRQRALPLAIGVVAAHVPELVDERRQRRCRPVAQHGGIIVPLPEASHCAGASSAAFTHSLLQMSSIASAVRTLV
jgi:hypothetical protein